MTSLTSAPPASRTSPERSPRSRLRFWRSPAGQPRWARPALLGIAALAALLYTWNITSSGFAPYYSLAARSMSVSWEAFLFTSLDPSATLTLDKIGGFLWPQALSARIFGFHDWALVLPQCVMGVISVLVMYRLVRRWQGPAAGLLAAGLLTVTPVAASMFGHAMLDGSVTMCLVLAADQYQRAVRSARLRSLLLCGLWIGLGFQAKMMEAWVIVPALFVGYVVAAPVRLRRRLGQLALAGTLMFAVSLSWVALMTFTPDRDRPYVDGSTDNSAAAMVFGYNGFNRLHAGLIDGAAPASSNGLWGRGGASRTPPPTGSGAGTAGADGRDPGDTARRPSDGPAARQPGGPSSGPANKQPGGSPNGHANRQPGGTANGQADRQPDGTPSGPANKQPGGTANGPANRQPGGTASGPANRQPDGPSSGPANKQPGGTANGQPDGTPNGHANRQPGGTASGPADRQPGGSASGPSGGTSGAPSDRSATAPPGAQPDGSTRAPATDGSRKGRAGAAPAGRQVGSEAPSRTSLWLKLLRSPRLTPQIAWLYPLALISLAIGPARHRKAPRTHQGRAGHLMWGTWLVTAAAVLSALGNLPHTAYVAILAPPLTALSAAGTVTLWRAHRAAAGGPRAWLLPAVVVVEAAWTIHLASKHVDFAPWLIPLLAAATLVAVLALAPFGTSRRAVLVVGLLAGCVAMFAAPTTWSLSVLNERYRGSAVDAYAGPGNDTRISTGTRTVRAGDVRVPTTPTPAQSGLLDYVDERDGSAKYAFSTEGWETSAPYVYATGAPVLPLTGLHADPLTLPEYRHLVATGDLRFALVTEAGRQTSKISSWVASACAEVDPRAYGATGRGSDKAPAQTLYRCEPSDATSH
ncbi:glycosyltransferase family 39 protein [Streptomyces venezuelae]|uniref:glycosyltransferase family 39 protein n=1 Tax=Streptomyces venezuelae TaxID=54571 RepID=UPI001CC247F0|nr:glycosyltransferase family 39 protein [Streptomyces venezuelae]